MSSSSPTSASAPRGIHSLHCFCLTAASNEVFESEEARSAVNKRGRQATWYKVAQYTPSSEVQCELRTTKTFKWGSKTGNTASITTRYCISSALILLRTVSKEYTAHTCNTRGSLAPVGLQSANWRQGSHGRSCPCFVGPPLFY